MQTIIRFTLHALILAREELRELLFRRKSIISLAIYFVTVAIVGFILAKIEVSLAQSFNFLDSDGPARDQFVERFATLGRRDVAEYLLLIGSLPRPVLLQQLLLVIWFPTMVSLVSCDMISLDLYRGSLRYILSRTSRSAYYLGKFISHLLLYTVLAAITWATLFALCSLYAANFQADRYLGMTIRYFLVGIIYLIFLVASTQFISCWSAKPVYAVTRLHLMWVAFFALLLLPGFSPIDPWITAGLLAPVDGRQIFAFAGFTIWAGLFSAIGFTIFRLRSV